MKFDSQKHHRRSIRLKGFDYSQMGAYFVTVVAQNRECMFGEIANTDMVLNDAGTMIVDQWNALPERFPTIELDTYQIMPNHLHGIIVIRDSTGVSHVDNQNVDAPNNRAGMNPAPTKYPKLGDIIGAFKSITTNKYILGVDNKNWPSFDNRLWQRNYCL